MKITAKVLDFNNYELKHECSFQDILKSYTSFNGSTILNCYDFEGERCIIFLTLLKSETEFEQLLCPENNFHGIDNGPYFKYILKGRIDSPLLKTVDIINKFDSKFIERDFKVHTLPLSGWDFINIKDTIYEFVDSTQYVNGKIELRVTEKYCIDNFYASFKP